MEHINIPEGQIHEPKGVSLSAANRVYISDGAGSGAWQQVNADALEGLISNSTPAGRRLVTDGSGGFNAEPVLAPSYGMMNLANNTTTLSVTAAATSDLSNNADYQEVTLPYTFNTIKNFVVGSNYLQVETSGVYQIDFWANAKSSVNGTVLALKWVVNDLDFVPRRPKLHLPNLNEVDNFSANGIHAFQAGDQIKAYIASTTSADITIEDLTFQMNLVELA